MPTEAGTGGLTIIDLVAYLYANNGLVVLIQPERLQRAFDILNGLFNRVDTRMNTGKTISMVCQPFHVPGGMSEKAFKRRMTGQHFGSNSGGGWSAQSVELKSQRSCC